MFVLWNKLFKKPFINLLFLLRGLSNAFYNPRVLNSFSFYFDFNFKKVFVIGFENILKKLSYAVFGFSKVLITLNLLAYFFHM